MLSPDSVVTHTGRQPLPQELGGLGVRRVWCFIIVELNEPAFADVSQPTKQSFRASIPWFYYSPLQSANNNPTAESSGRNPLVDVELFVPPGGAVELTDSRILHFFCLPSVRAQEPTRKIDVEVSTRRLTISVLGDPEGSSPR